MDKSHNPNSIAEPLLVVYYNKECEPEVEDYIVHNTDKAFLALNVIKFVQNNYIKKYCLSLFNQYVVQVNSFKECLDMFYPSTYKQQTSKQNQMSFQFKDQTKREQPLHPTFSNNIGQDVLRYRE